MQQHEKLFLEALKASLENRKLTWTEPLSSATWQSFFALADAQKVLPLIFDVVFPCPAAKLADERFMQSLKQRSISSMMTQIQKTTDFLKIYEDLSSIDVPPLVVKGIVCRELYPNPDLRISGDEDLLTDETLFEKYIEILKSNYGLKQLNSQENVESSDQIELIAEKGVTYIELHRHLFAASSESYGDLNRYFTDAFENCIAMEVQGTTIYTMEPTMHLFYLICHAFKHFLHSGFGIRQVCDMVMFANAYGSEIDWSQLLKNCCEIHADIFTAALFKIGKNHLVFDENKACYPKEWRDIEVDESDLLLELLGSGIYGNTTMSRMHSSNMTLDAVAAQKNGKRVKNSVIKSAFPPLKSMEGRYPYLKKYPYLLPAAWLDRILKYYKETSTTQDNNALDTVRIGNQRIELLKQYGIIER